MRDATDISILLDRSGSMDAIRDDVIGGFNRFLRDQQAVPGDCVLSLVQFDTLGPYDILCTGKPIAEVAPLDEAHFVPRAGTPLFDAMGRLLIETGLRLEALPEPQRPDKVLVVIITDGYENASREFTRERIFEMVKHQQDTYNWQFVFLAANQDAIQSGAGLGIGAGTSATFGANPAGVHAAFVSVSHNTTSYRNTGDPANMSYTHDQRKRMNTGN